MSHRIQILAVVIMVFSANFSLAQVFQRRCLHVRNHCLQKTGLPSCAYRTDNPAVSSVGFGYGIRQAPTGRSSEIDSNDRLTFRFPSPLSAVTAHGNIRLTEIGAQLDSKGNLMFSAKLDHDGGPDGLLKSPQICIELDVQTSLSNQTTPPPNAVSIKTFKQWCRADLVPQKTIRIASLDPSDRSLLSQNFGSITHIRVQMTYFPDR